MNTYATWFGRVVGLGVLANFSFAVLAFLKPNDLLAFLQLGSVESTVWLFNYSVLLVMLSCFYIPAALDPFHYLVNAWLLIVARLIPATTFFVGVFVSYLAKGFLTLGIVDSTIGVVELILLILALRAASGVKDQPESAF
ncbi:MAG: hypothetical protein MJA27_24180 [Pseudanabaenales cyanobacterium]|nr:hypothetical protein [Pseudanabaenales cyanobacterium]